MPIDQNELLQALRNGALVNALNGLPYHPTLYHNMEAGIVVWGRNELGVYATEDDPSAFRGGSITGGLVKFSGNLLVEHESGWIVWDSPTGQKRYREEELVLFQFKQDERFRDLPLGDPRRLSGEVTLHVRDGAASGDGMIKKLEIRHDSITLLGPIVSEAITTPPSGPSGGGSRFYSPNRRFCWNCQDDGHQVQYDTHNSTNEASWTAVWSNWLGLLKPLPWV